MKRIVGLFICILFVSAATAGMAVSPRQCTRKVTDHWFACSDTLSSMRAIQTAVEAYALDHKRYPAARSMAELRDLVQPTYIQKTPLVDAWGTEFRYLASPDGKSYRLVSAGSDKVFDESSWNKSGLLESSKEDALFSSGDDDREWAIQE